MHQGILSRRAILPTTDICLGDFQACRLVCEHLASFPDELGHFLGEGLQKAARPATLRFLQIAHCNTTASSRSHPRCEPWTLASALIKLWTRFLEQLTTLPAAVALNKDASWLAWLRETYRLHEFAVVYCRLLLHDWFSRLPGLIEYPLIDTELDEGVLQPVRIMSCLLSGAYPCISSLDNVPQTIGYLRECSENSRVKMLAARIDALYESRGFPLKLWRPVDAPTARVLRANGDPGEAVSLTHSDLELFVNLAAAIPVAHIIAIGNGFGYSTFALADIFDAEVDVIEASLYRHSKLGINFTRDVAVATGQRIQVHVGRSPQAVSAVAASKSYDLAFIDGAHTETQVILDFSALEPHMAHNCVVVMHDAATRQVARGVKGLLAKYTAVGFSYKSHVSASYRNVPGTGYFFRGFSEHLFAS